MPVFAAISDEPFARHEMRYARLVMSWERVGERLRRALVAKPTDRGVLATSARIPELELAALERGEATKVSTGALARLARELSLPPTALWSEDPQTDIELSLRFRHASVPDFFHADESVARRAILDARKLAELDALLGRRRSERSSSLARLPGNRTKTVTTAQGRSGVCWRRKGSYRPIPIRSRRISARSARYAWTSSSLLPNVLYSDAFATPARSITRSMPTVWMPSS